MERWKPIEYGGGQYSVSDLGRVRSNVTGQIKTCQTINRGYKIVHLYFKNVRKAITVHRLVALAFIPLVEGKNFVDHIDCNPSNNTVGNLRWVTPKENSEYASQNGRYKNSGEKARIRMSEIGKKFAKQNGDNLRRLAKLISKPILQMTMDGKVVNEYPSIKQAERETKCYNLNKVVKGEYCQSGGFKWRLK